MFDFVEPRVRRMVAEHLGVGTEELTADVSLTDDLAADSLDLVELALAVEREFAVHVPESVLEGVRTFGELVDLVRRLALRRGGTEVRVELGSEPPLVWARIVPPRGRGNGSLQRAGRLTPYAAETIAEDALRAGEGARLEMAVSATVTDSGLAHLVDQFAWLGDRGVEVSIRRDQNLGASGQRVSPHAA